MKKLLLLGILLLGLSASAANWKEVGYKLYVDVDNIIAYDGGYYGVWTKMLAYNPSSRKGKQLWYDLGYDVFDCNRKRYKMVSNIAYDINRRVIDSFDDSDRLKYIDWQLVPPESRIETVYNYVCK